MKLPIYIDKHPFYGYCNRHAVENPSYTHCYIIKLDNTNNYKIGIASNLKARLRDYNGHSPFNHSIIAVLSQEKPSDFAPLTFIRSIEKQLLSSYKEKKGEWIKLENEQEEKDLICRLFDFDN